MAHVLHLAQTPAWLEAEEACERERGEKENDDADSVGASSKSGRRSAASDARSKASSKASKA